MYLGYTQRQLIAALKEQTKTTTELRTELYMTHNRTRSSLRRLEDRNLVRRIEINNKPYWELTGTGRHQTGVFES